jgi:Fe-S oxidoreductase
MACVEACPVGVEHVPVIVDMRRALVDRGDLDPVLARTLENYAGQGNSYGKSARMRARWTKGLEFKIPDARLEPVEYVWFVGDFASFDERVQVASARLARILYDAGVSFGLLYEGERNAGNDVRRVGEEGLFEMLVEHNMGVFRGARFKAIFTTDPHSLNTLRNEYPQYGLDKPVYHYTELLADLLARGVISLGSPLAGTRVTYHDPCYLARYNGITEAPRRLIEATGAELVEMPRHGVNTYCCGAGGGRIWMSESEVEGERPSEQRIREAQSLGELDYFVVSCPKDLVMYTDAANTIGAEFEVVELTTLLERAITADAPAPDAQLSALVSSSATSNRSATTP